MRSAKMWMVLMCPTVSFFAHIESLSVTVNNVECVYKYMLYEGDTVSGNFVVVNHDIFWSSDHLGIDFTVFVIVGIFISVGGDGLLGKIFQNPIHVANILKTLILILMWYNKILLGDHMGKFPAPFLMNTIHFTMQAVLSKFITWFWSHKFEANVVISWRDYFLRDGIFL